ncbi:hypothetical protein [Bradyrhizobium macuxiense]|nr:hypothetical protein [Bradyrhizobium macuxiense]
MKATLGEFQALRLLGAFSKIDDEDKRKAVLEHVEAEAGSSTKPKKK